MSILKTDGYQDKMSSGDGWYHHTDDDEVPPLSWIQQQQAIGLSDRYDYRPEPYIVVNGVAIPEGIASKQVGDWLFAGNMVGCHPVGRVDGQWSSPSDFFYLVYLDLTNRQFVCGRYTPPLPAHLNLNNIDARAKWQWTHTKLDGMVNAYAHVFDGLAMWAGNVWTYQFCEVYTIEDLNAKFKGI